MLVPMIAALEMLDVLYVLLAASVILAVIWLGVLAIVRKR